MKFIFTTTAFLLLCHLTIAQILHFNTSDFCLDCDQDFVNDTLSNGDIKERFYIVKDNDRNGEPDNEDLDITPEVLNYEGSTYYIILVHYKGQGVLGNIAFADAPLFCVAMLDSGEIVYKNNELGWCQGPNYNEDGGIALFALATNHELINPYLHWNGEAQDKYIGMSLSDKNDGKPLYGWIRISKPDGVGYMHIKDWAYNPNPYQPILTGSTEMPKLVSKITLRSETDSDSINSENGTLRLIPEILPDVALIKDLEWYFEGTAKAGISITENGLITAFINGTYMIRASAQDGSGSAGYFEVKVTGQSPTLVTKIEIKEEDDFTEITEDNGYLTFSAKIEPENADIKSVTWSVDNPELAEISQQGKFTAKKDGKVIVLATAQDGSGITSTYEINISNQEWTTSISAENKANPIIFPNPADDFIYLKNIGNSEIINIKIFDVFGKNVLNTKLNNSQIDVSKLNSGIYFLKIFDENQNVFIKKIIIR